MSCTISDGSKRACFISQFLKLNRAKTESHKFSTQSGAEPAEGDIGFLCVSLRLQLCASAVKFFLRIQGWHVGSANQSLIVLRTAATAIGNSHPIP
jgi:hypothetical protein